MRRIAKTKKIGHLGTLDPIATGVLPLVIGRATRLAQFYTRSDKIYEGVVRFGWSTDYLRPRGRADQRPERVRLDRGGLWSGAGAVPRRVPADAAAGLGEESGRPARLRAGAASNMAVELEPVTVHVYELTVLEIDGRRRGCASHCSGGTYMRSIAHDVGQALGCGAHLQELRRVASGEFDLDQARTLAQLESLAADERLVDALVPAAKLLPGFP